MVRAEREAKWSTRRNIPKKGSLVKKDVDNTSIIDVCIGTGQDSVIINDTSGNRTKAVRRVLGQDAIIAARILFGIAG
mgnify:CR=1 FL=1